jgi:sugar phosphate isomerase/epimerase
MQTHAMTRREFVSAAAAAATFGACARPSRAADAAPAAPWPLYAFGNAFRDKELAALEENCRLLKDLGYAGIELHHNPAALPKALETLDRHGLKLSGVYATPKVEDAPPADWDAWIRLLKGRDTRIELGLTSKAFKASDPAADEKGVAWLKAVSDLCADSGPVVSVYPHAGFWTERCEDGVRLAKAVARKNVGTHFNLVHWQWVQPAKPAGQVLAEAKPHLLAVTINGLKGPAEKRQAIRPLDDSDLDLAAFLAEVKRVGFAGPVGLQCYSVKEPPEEHLKRSMEAWRKLTAGL